MPPKGEAVSEEEHLLLAPLPPHLKWAAGQGWGVYLPSGCPPTAPAGCQRGAESVCDKGVQGGMSPLCGSEARIPAFSGF